MRDMGPETLLKLFRFGSYVGAAERLLNLSQQEVIEKELTTFVKAEFRRKENYVVSQVQSNQRTYTYTIHRVS